MFVLSDGEVDVAAKIAGVVGDELVFRGDGRDVLKHGLALVRVKAERGNHVNQAVCVDVFLMGVAAKDELELWSGDHFADDVEHVVSDDAFCGGEITDAHLDDPTLDIRDVIRAPLLDVLLHRDVLRLPMIVFHRLIEVVGPGVLEREDVKKHRFLTVNDTFCVKGGLCLRFIEDEGALTEFDCGSGHGWNQICVGKVGASRTRKCELASKKMNQDREWSQSDFRRCSIHKLFTYNI